MIRAVVAGVAGLLFGFGLALSGMTDTRVVLGFLDLAGEWNPTLAFVMGGALLVTMPVFALLKRRSKPLLEASFCLPQKRGIDGALICGSLMFGAGWGLYGYCPGPALASLASLQSSPAVFVAAMAVGMVLQRILDEDTSQD